MRLSLVLNLRVRHQRKALLLRLPTKLFVTIFPVTKTMTVRSSFLFVARLSVQHRTPEGALSGPKGVKSIFR